MATVYGVNRTKMLTPIGSNILDQGVNKGNVCFMYDTYEASAAAADTVIEVCDKLPDGAVVTKIDILTDDLGTGVTIDVGDQATADRYADGIDVASAAADTIFPTITEIAGYGYQAIAGTSDQLQIKILGSAATGTIKIGVMYSV